MRAKVLLIVAALALAVLAPALYFRFKPNTPAPVTDQPVAVETAAPPATALPPILKRVTQAAPRDSLPDATSASTMGLTHDQYIEQRTAQLSQLGMTDNPANLKIILSEIQNPEASIRHAALSAAVDFHSKDAIPTLENDMAYASDPQEKVDIQQAIDFLNLPSVNDPIAAAPGQPSAAGN